MGRSPLPGFSTLPNLFRPISQHSERCVIFVSSALHRRNRQNGILATRTAPYCVWNGPPAIARALYVDVRRTDALDWVTPSWEQWPAVLHLRRHLRNRLIGFARLAATNVLVTVGGVVVVVVVATAAGVVFRVWHVVGPAHYPGVL